MPTAQLKENLNPFDIAREQFNIAADLLELSQSMRDVLINPKRQLIVSVPVKMDNGTTRSYTYSNKPEFRDGDRVKTFEDGRRLALIAN